MDGPTHSEPPSPNRPINTHFGKEKTNAVHPYRYIVLESSKFARHVLVVGSAVGPMAFLGVRSISLLGSRG